MVKLPDWIKVAEGLGDLSQIAEWLRPVGELAEKWRELGAGLVGIVQNVPLDDPFKVVRHVLDHLGDAPVQELLDKVGGAGLAQRVNDAKQKIDDSSLAGLLAPLSAKTEDYLGSGPVTDRFARDDGSNAGLIALAIPKLEAAPEGAVGPVDFTFAFAGEAALELESGAVWPFRADAVAPGLLRIGAKAKMSARAGLRVPLADVGSFGGNLDADGSVDFGYFYRPQGDPIMASALLPRLIGLPNPFDLVDIRNAMAHGDLEGMAFFINGAFSAGVEVGIGQDIAIPSFLTGKIGLDAAISCARQSTWILSLRKVGGRLVFILSRKKTSEEEWRLGGKIGFEISGLALKVNQELQKLSEISGVELRKIKPFLSPGTYALTELRQWLDDSVAALVRDEALAKALKADAGVLLGDPARGGLALEGWLGSKIAAAIDSVEQGFEAEADKLVKSALEAVQQSIPSFAPDEVGAGAKRKLTELVEAGKAKLKALLDELTATTAKSRALAKELAEIGIAVQDLGNEADAALAGVRRLVAQYEKFLRDVTAVTEKAAKAQLAIDVSLGGSESQGIEYELMGSLPAVGAADEPAEIAQLWRSLMLGKLEPFQRFLHDQSLVPAGLILEPASSMARFATTNRGFAASLVGLDAEIAFSSIAQGEAKVRLSNGTVVVSAAAEATRRRAFLGRPRVARFISAYDLVAHRATGQTRSMTASVSLVRSDDDLTDEDYDIFRSRLLTYGLIDAKSDKAANDALADMRAAAGANAKYPGDVSVRIEMTPRGVDNMIALGRLSRAEPEIRFALSRLAMRVLIATGLREESDFERCCRQLQMGANDDPYRYFYSELRKDGSLRNVFAGPSHGPSPPDYVTQFQDFARSCFYLPRMFEAMAAIFDTEPSTAGSGPGTAEDYADKERALAQTTRPWLKLIGRKGKTHPTMLSLLRILVGMNRPMNLTTVEQARAEIERLELPLVGAESDPFIVLTIAPTGREARDI